MINTITLFVAVFSAGAFTLGAYLTRSKAAIDQRRHGLRLFIVAFVLDWVVLGRSAWIGDWKAAGIVGAAMFLLLLIFAYELFRLLALLDEAEL